MGSVGKLPSETKEQMRAGRHLKNVFLRAQELLILTRKKLGRGSRRPAWLSRDLSGKPRHKTKMHRQWRRGIPPEKVIGTWPTTAGRGSGRPRNSNLA